MASSSTQNDVFIPSVVKVVKVPLFKLVADSRISPREYEIEIRAPRIMKAIKEYSRVLRHSKFPPLKVAPLGNGRFIIVDGLLRFEACKKAKIREIEVEVLDADGTDSARMALLALYYNLFHAIKLPTKAIRKYAAILYQQGETLENIIIKTHQSQSTVYRWTEKIRERKEKDTADSVYNLHLQEKTQQEISKIMAISQSSVSRILSTQKKKRNKTK